MLTQSEITAKAISAIAGLVAAPPVLYGPDNRPLRPSGSHAFRRDAARRTGSMKNWVPQRLFGKQAEALEREQIVERSIDLSQNDPNAAGVIENIATYVVGAGLSPHLSLDHDVLGISRKKAKKIQAQQRNIYNAWSLFADAGSRMSFPQLQFLLKCNMLRYGESFTILPMIKDPLRPYSLACQMIHPLRVKTPADRSNDSNIKDGIELGTYGETTHIWIKKSDPTGIMPDISKHFVRMPVRNGHRLNILHSFFCKDPEQVRGVPFFAPAMKYFRDFNDLLNAELVSSVVTAALTYFIETSTGDPYDIASNFNTISDTRYDSDGNEKEIRYQETYPGAILYGNTGEKPHLLSADRPGTTFEPFTRVIKKAISMSLNLPYQVVFKDVENTNFAGFRSAMLDAWRVFTMNRKWLGDSWCQPIYTMLQEEAYLRGDLSIPKFYENMHGYTRAEWRGAPKGDIEPVKAVQADVMAVANKIKTRRQVMIEHGTGTDYEAFMDQVEEEQKDLEARELVQQDAHSPENAGSQPSEENVQKYEGLKLKADFYGVAVRAGAITPQQPDEKMFRSDAGLPEISRYIQDAWQEDGGTRRPITLKAGEAFDAEMNRLVGKTRSCEDTDEDEGEADNQEE